MITLSRLHPVHHKGRTMHNGTINAGIFKTVHMYICESNNTDSTICCYILAP